MKSILAFLFIGFLTSCFSKKYPPEKYTISQKCRDLISSFKEGDTLKFQDDAGTLSSFLIQKIDSTLLDKRGPFINAKEYKDISIACHELANSRRGFEDYYMITIVKEPEIDSTGFDLRLKDFYGSDNVYAIDQNNDTVIANNIRFTNYYLFRARNRSEQKESSSVTQIYMTQRDGIIAYRCLDGAWWTRLK